MQRWICRRAAWPALKQPLLHYTTWDSDQYLYKMNRYAGWGALNMRDAKRRPNLLAMVTRAPLRFLQLYFLRLGFLDGVAGFQICMHTAYYAFLKQAKLWELHYALQQPDPEAERSAQLGEQPILAFSDSAQRGRSRRRQREATTTGGVNLPKAEAQLS